MRRSAPLAALLLLLAVAGCCRSVAPADVHMALQRVNANQAGIDQPVQCKGWVSFRFRDADGHTHRYLSDDASLIFAAPRGLRFDVRHSLAGSVAQFGSDGRRYWLWVEPETPKLWWGHWACVERGAATRLPIPPDQLLDALLLRPLPETLADGRPPRLEQRWAHYWLVYDHQTPSGQSAGRREIRLDRCEPYQPVEIIDRRPDGRIVMHARLKSYARIGPDGPLTPRRYVVTWPLDDAKMNLDIHRARFRPELEPADVFEFPTQWHGDIEVLDAPDCLTDPDTSSPPAAP